MLLQTNQMHIPSLFAELCYKQKGRMYFLGRTSLHHVERKAVKENNVLKATLRTLDSRHTHMLICRIPTNIRGAKKLPDNIPFFYHWGGGRVLHTLYPRGFVPVCLFKFPEQLQHRYAKPTIHRNLQFKNMVR